MAKKGVNDNDIKSRDYCWNRSPHGGQGTRLGKRRAGVGSDLRIIFRRTYDQVELTINLQRRNCDKRISTVRFVANLVFREDVFTNVRRKVTCTSLRVTFQARILREVQGVPDPRPPTNKGPPPNQSPFLFLVPNRCLQKN